MNCFQGNCKAIVYFKLTRHSQFTCHNSHFAKIMYYQLPMPAIIFAKTFYEF